MSWGGEEGRREGWTLGSRMFIPSSTRAVLLLLILYLKKKKAIIGVKSTELDIRNPWVSICMCRSIGLLLILIVWKFNFDPVHV